ncbi:MAG: exoribonuclease II [Buchnera aphidicola (Periphyllus lyropictus)]|uniref:exoribonuclease II n=1 Tax=Buchnera aphidicola TaxID=9 RepID=UPI001ED7574D|nr:exoribonuclease II [Buchnera aphidicola]NIH16613.1 exoribonuclease II [Buchnera aphidicola (Periphyllus lyropictus)]USS94525.1 exoribonuclease II [Buchnera aphidicola (Periphyllus lyropictus)]
MFYNNIVLMQLKKKLKINTERVEGIVKKSEKGYGFLEIDSKVSYFIPPKKIKKVMNGDRIIAKKGFSKNREIVIPEKLIEPYLNTFIGYLQKINQQYFIIPDNQLLKEYIPCNYLKKDISKFESGDWFLAKLTKHKLNQNVFHAELIKFISKKKDPFTPWWIVLSKYNLKKNEPKIDLNNIVFDKNIPRKDLTNFSFITIDNNHTKDIDDAVFIKKKKDGSFFLIVAISDTTAFISYNSKLDVIASKRSFTNYLPGLNVPMLPRFLSEDLCSLKPNKKRPVLACKMIIKKNGSIKNSSSFFLAWIKSKAKLSYRNVSNWIEKKGSWKPLYKDIKNQLKLLYDFCLLRINWREKNSFIFPERLEYKFHLSKLNEVLNISIEKRRIAHKIIEECMIAANLTAAKILSKKKGFGLYNNHAGFDASNINYVSSFLKKKNIIISSKKLLTLKGFCNLYKILKKKKYKYLVNRIRKFQSFSEISLIPKPHYALGLKQYATWTSPIRKYGDIINHRFLKSIILNTKPFILKKDIIQNISNQKRKHRLSERDIEDFLYLEYFKKNNFEDKIFFSEIFEISRGGIRAKLLETGANIFIPSSFIHRIRSELDLNQDKGLIYLNGKLLYKISDVIKVKILNFRTNSKSIIAKLI